MFDIEQAIKKWKQGLAANQAMEEGYVAELEAHLRDRVEELTGQGVAAQDAFEQTVKALGKTERIGGEFYKAHTVSRSGRPSWQPPRFVPALLWNYFKVAGRTLRREKLYALINITGLSVGMACFILLGLWVKSELSFDHFHVKKDRIFRVLNRLSDGRLFTTPTYALAPELKSSYPEVEEFSRVWSWQASLVTWGKRHFQEYRIGLADPGFFRMFTFPFVAGDAASALAAKNAVVLTEAMAKKYFGRKSALGKILYFDQYKTGFLVTGVIKNIPADSHIQFDMMARVELLGEDRLARWSEWTGPCYVLLRPGVSPRAFENKIRDIYRKHIAPDVPYAPVLQELTRVNLEQSGRPDNIKRVLLFSLIAIGILLLACVNFINLLTARAARRAREIGLRKVVGASRGQIVRQFLAETLLMSIGSMMLALLWARLLLPGFNRLTSKSLSLFSTVGTGLILPLALLTLLTGLLAGSYPALLLSRFRPVQVLKQQWHPGGRGAVLRKVLIVFQFAVAAVLVTFTLAVNKQLRYIDTIDLGFDRENIVGFLNNPVLMEHFSAFKTELLGKEGIIGASAGAKAPTMVGETIPFYWQGDRSIETLFADYTVADYDYFKTFAMRIVAGRDFSPRFPRDENESCVINETAMRQMGVKNPIGMNIRMEHPAWPESFRYVRIIGVVRDFHSRTLHMAIRPFVFRMYKPWHSQVFVKIDGHKTAAAQQAIEKTFQRHAPGYPFEFMIYDEAYQRQYTLERVMRQLLWGFTLLALFIACLGLFGLTAFTMEQKSREVGVRRVFGASIPRIAWMNIAHFLRWVAIAHVIACPLAYYLIRKWLQQFAYPIGIDLCLFAFSAGLTLLVALSTVAFMAVRAARANPVDSLRYE
jgi:putative ABC transport system permease protein